MIHDLPQHCDDEKIKEQFNHQEYPRGIPDAINYGLKYDLKTSFQKPEVQNKPGRTWRHYS